ncbi:hypothetical protein [Tessaracoccus sp. MC1756]|uniref:hypothetical protein n=1 Tax=Tessaracoccus sp. MC1756 TaxID=2760311 RepID=UPI0016012DF5|nr:hypothetical protein [Tessaracoccus sp. MC1756]MBB1509633.1 hypothetical protein [Tessaracoccus sp. MC1756]
MRKWSVGALGAAVVLAGCTPLSPGLVPTSAASPPSSLSPSVTSTEPSLPPVPEPELPQRFPIDGPLVDSAELVVDELHAVAAGLPVLKLDITRDQATLTALRPDGSVVSYRWTEDEITAVDSDIQYLEQATFDPADFPLQSAARMFDIADLRGVRGELVLQIVEYREGQVLMTITSRPESTTVFFRADGTAVAQLGYTSVADLTAGLSEVIGDATEAFAVGFNDTRGYWTDLPDEPGVVLNRSRLAGLPVFETRRGEAPALGTFDPQQIDPATLAKVIAQFQADPAQQCDVRIDRSTERSGAVVRVDCGGEVHYTDLEGRDMTRLIEG